MTSHVIAVGGGFSCDDAGPLDDYVLDRVREIRRTSRLRVCFLGTASGDAFAQVGMFYRAFPAGVAHPTHVGLFQRQHSDLKPVILEQDLVYVGCGNTASMLAVWRAHGVDDVLREAYESGVVLAGASAGAMCWFAGGVTKAYGPTATAYADGLRLLDGSLCPHYGGPDGRRAAYLGALTRGELPPGIGLDDGAALHLADGAIVDAVAVRAGARAFRVSARDGGFVEDPLPGVRRYPDTAAEAATSATG